MKSPWQLCLVWCKQILIPNALTLFKLCFVGVMQLNLYLYIDFFVYSGPSILSVPSMPHIPGNLLEQYLDNQVLHCNQQEWIAWWIELMSLQVHVVVYFLYLCRKTSLHYKGLKPGFSNFMDCIQDMRNDTISEKWNGKDIYVHA